MQQTTNNNFLQVSASAFTVLRCLASGLDMKSAEYIASLGAINTNTKGNKNESND